MPWCTSGSARYAATTAGSRLAVYIFVEGASAEKINDSVGTTALSRQDHYYSAGNLLVFSLRDSVVYAVDVVLYPIFW